MCLHNLLQWLGCICNTLLLANSCLIPPWRSICVTCDLSVVCPCRPAWHWGLQCSCYWNSFGKLTFEWAFNSDVCLYLLYDLFSCWECDWTHTQDTTLFMCSSPLALCQYRGNPAYMPSDWSLSSKLWHLLYGDAVSICTPRVVYPLFYMC